MGEDDANHFVLNGLCLSFVTRPAAEAVPLTSPKMYPNLGDLFMLEMEITARALAANLGSAEGAPVLLDVREPWEVATAQIAGSKSIPMGEIPARAFQELDPDAHIITICHAGVRSMNVALWLRNMGFDKVQSLSGGIDSWSREVDPSVPRY